MVNIVVDEMHTGTLPYCLRQVLLRLLGVLFFLCLALGRIQTKSLSIHNSAANLRERSDIEGPLS
jgi:hypothetical protein